MPLRDYELMYIVRPTVEDEGFPVTTERVDGMIGNLGGEVVEKLPWSNGRRRLAYPIEKFEEGYYVLAKIKLEPGRVGDLEEQLRISDDVIRHIVVEPVAITPPRMPRVPREPQPQA